MEPLFHFFEMLHDLPTLVVWAGYIGLAIIVFCETGLLAGFFLPGDSLLVAAGIIAAQGKFDVFLLITLLSLAAVLGDSVGYAIGYCVGPKIFNREDSLFFQRRHVERTHAFFERHGGKTIVLARFVPIVRTFAPTVAGVGRMSYRYFAFYNIAGGVGWVLSMVSLGYFLGRYVADIEQSLPWIVALVVLLSFMPLLIEWLRQRRAPH